MFADFKKLSVQMNTFCEWLTCRGIIIATTQAKLSPPPPQHYCAMCACVWVSSYVCLCFQRSSRQLKYMYSIPHAVLLWGGPNTAPLKTVLRLYSKRNMVYGTLTPKLTITSPYVDSIINLKGLCHEIFCFWFFSWINFPQASDYTIRAVSNFSQFGEIFAAQGLPPVSTTPVANGKTFRLKNFNNFVWTPLGSRVNIYINFCLQVHFQVFAAWYCCHYLPPVSTPPAANLPTVSLMPVAICHRRCWREMEEKFATCVVDTDGASWLANISAYFRKRFKWNTLGLGGNWFMKKTRSKKCRDTVPLIHVRCAPYARVHHILQSGTKNLASDEVEMKWAC